MGTSGPGTGFIIFPMGGAGSTVSSGVCLLDSGDVPVFYSLGNFAFASYSENAKTGLIADLEFQGGKVISSRVTPVNVYNAEVNFQPTPFSEDDQTQLNKYLEEISVPLNKNMIVIDKKGIVTRK